MNVLKKNKVQKSSGSFHAEIKELISSITLDARWFRRVIHTSSAGFIGYYLLPDEPAMNIIKIIVPIVIFSGLAILEYLRLQLVIDHSEFFGLRDYEKKRPASYLYFGSALIILFLLFPQQIAVPCILCACFTDPVMGECRYHLGKKIAIVVGFLLSFCFFVLFWHTVPVPISFLIPVIGATSAVIGEIYKNRYLDDDFLIQMAPAFIIGSLWQLVALYDVNILPSPLIYPMI